MRQHSRRICLYSSFYIIIGSMIKRVILLRHGATAHNAQRIFQSDTISLSPAGRQQIEDFASTARKLNIDLIIHSPVIRASESAAIIAQVIDKPMKEDNLLVELQNPPEIRGRSYNDPAADKIYQAWLAKLKISQSLADPQEENYFDMYNRARKVLKEVSKQKESTILVVSHSEFIRTIISCVLLGDNSNIEQIASVVKRFKLRNARSVTLEYNETKELWRVAL